MPAQHDNDPFLTPAPGAMGQRREPEKSVSAASLALQPWLCFTFIVLLYVLLYHHVSILVNFFVLVVIAMALGMIFARSGAMGFLLLVAAMMAALMGLVAYQTYLRPYWACREYRAYTNVLPTESADGHADAGKITFTRGTRVDTSRAVGFKNRHTYCVAPVMDETSNGRAEFWAAGMDCCAAREDMWCGDVRKEGARSGIVLLPEPSIFDHWVPSDMEMYNRAVKLAAAQYELTTPTDPVFVQWVADAEEGQAAFAWGALYFFIIASIVYLVFSCMAGFVASVVSRPNGPRKG